MSFFNFKKEAFTNKQQKQKQCKVGEVVLRHKRARMIHCFIFPVGYYSIYNIVKIINTQKQNLNQLAWLIIHSVGEKVNIIYHEINRRQ